MGIKSLRFIFELGFELIQIASAGCLLHKLKITLEVKKRKFKGFKKYYFRGI
jgi:hypothetical protein